MPHRDAENPEEPHAGEQPAPDESNPDEPGPDVPTPDELEQAIETVLLAREAAGADPLPAGAATRLATHAYLMCMANTQMNLTRIVEPAEIATKHVLDSILVADIVDIKNSRILDIGTGAGYPGIPLAIAVPSASVAMIDGTEKKAVFVEDAIEELGLGNAAALHGRAEVHLKEHYYDFLVARAVGPLERLLPLLLSRRQCFRALLAMKGPGGSEEWNTAYKNDAARGFELAAVHEYELTGRAGKRTLLVISPTGERHLKPMRPRDIKAKKYHEEKDNRTGASGGAQSDGPSGPRRRR